MNRTVPGAFFLIVLLSGCASYAPPEVDQKTGRYVSGAILPSGAVERRDTSVDVSKYRFVYLNSTTNVYPERFEFFVRAALANIGLKRVLNQQELTSMVTSMPSLSNIQSLSDPLSRRRLGERIGPVLTLDFESRWDGDVRRYVSVQITDMSSGKVLLRVNHGGVVWWETDTEYHYPVFNAIKDWFDESRARSGGKSA